MRLVKALVPLLALGGCTGLVTAGSQPGTLSGTAAGLFGIPAATVFQQISAEITQIEMLKAQLDGMTMPVLPMPVAPAAPTSPIIPTIPTSPINVPIVPSGSPTGTITPGPVVVVPPSPIAAPVPQPTVP